MALSRMVNGLGVWKFFLFRWVNAMEENKQDVPVEKKAVVSQLGLCGALSAAIVLALVFFPYRWGFGVAADGTEWFLEQVGFVLSWLFANPGWLFGPLGFAFLFCSCASLKKSLGMKLNQKFDCAGVVVLLLLLFAFVGYSLSYVAAERQERLDQGR